MRPSLLLSSLPLLLVALAGCPPTESSDVDGGGAADFTTPSAIVKSSGDAQIIPAGGTPSPLRVTVFTPTGHKCNGCTVTWTMSPGQFQGGSVASTTSVFGEAGLNLTGFQSGAYTITATIGNGQSAGFSVTFQ